MRNPFQLGGPVSGPDLCGRERELASARDELAREGRVVVGPSGWGVTSFVDELLRRLDGERPVVRRNLWPALSGDEVRRCIDGVRAPGESTGASDDPVPVGVLEGAACLPAEWAGQLREAVEAPAKASPLVLAVDGGRGWGALPVPGEGGGEDGWPGVPVLRLGPLPRAAWLPYVLERFLETRRWIANEHVHATVERTGGHPRLTQQLFHLLWDACEPGGAVDAPDVEGAWRVLLRWEAPRLQDLWTDLTLNQRRVLRGLAVEGPGASPYSSDFVGTHHLASPSSAQRALQGLEDRGIVRSRDGRREISDPLLPSWIRTVGCREPEPQTEPGTPPDPTP